MAGFNMLSQDIVVNIFKYAPSVRAASCLAQTCKATSSVWRSKRGGLIKRILQEDSVTHADTLGPEVPRKLLELQHPRVIPLDPTRTVELLYRNARIVDSAAKRLVVLLTDAHRDYCDLLPTFEREYGDDDGSDRCLDEATEDAWKLHGAFVLWADLYWLWIDHLSGRECRERLYPLAFVIHDVGIDDFPDVLDPDQQLQENSDNDSDYSDSDDSMATNGFHESLELEDDDPPYAVQIVHDIMCETSAIADVIPEIEYFSD